MLPHVVSKIDDCNSTTEVSKSVDLLQAIRWSAQAWENVSESTINKCFIKVGFLSEDESLVSFPEEHQEFDPFQELTVSELVQVSSLLHNASSGSGTDVPSADEALLRSMPRGRCCTTIVISTTTLAPPLFAPTNPNKCNYHTSTST